MWRQAHVLAFCSLLVIWTNISTALAQTTTCVTIQTVTAAPNNRLTVSECTVATIPRGATGYVLPGGSARVLAEGVTTVAGGQAGGAGVFTFSGGVLNSLGRFATVYVSPTAMLSTSFPSVTGVTFSLPWPALTVPITFTVSGTSNTINFYGAAASGRLNVGVEGASNTIRIDAGTLQVSGTSNLLTISASVTATITGSSNRLTPIGGPAYSFVDPSNTIVAAFGRLATSTRGDGQIYTVEPGGILIITEPNFETLWTSVGTLLLAGASARVTVSGNAAAAIVTDCGRCDVIGVTTYVTELPRCTASGSSGTISVTNAGIGVLRGQGGTVYATADPRPTDTRLMAQATAVGANSLAPNTVYLGPGGRGVASTYNEIHVGSGATGRASPRATGFAESGGLLTVLGSAIGIVSAGASVTALSGGTIRLAESSATVMAQPGATVLAGPTSLFATPVATGTDGAVIYSARLRLVSDPYLKRALPIVTGLPPCVFPMVFCKGITGQYRCVDTRGDISDCGGCALGSLDWRTPRGVDCTSDDGNSDEVSCRAGKCV